MTNTSELYSFQTFLVLSRKLECPKFIFYLLYTFLLCPPQALPLCLIYVREQAEKIPRVIIPIVLAYMFRSARDEIPSDADDKLMDFALVDGSCLSQ